MSSEPHDGAGDDADPEDDLPIYRAQETPEAVPGFVARVLERLSTEPTDEDFTFEGVDVEIAGDLWLAPIGAYDPEQDVPSTPEEIAAGASPTGPWGNAMLDWETGVRRAMRDSWGEPVIHTPRLVGTQQEPEGILDYVLVAQDFAEAELWDRGDRFVALLTKWAGVPGASFLSQALVILPRALVMGGMGAALNDEDTEHERLMYGEHPIELARRAWALSSLYGPGEVRLRGGSIEAWRFSLQTDRVRGRFSGARGTTTVWTVADDGRQLVLVHDPSCGFAELVAKMAEGDVEVGDNGAPAVYSDLQLILISRLLDGVPADLVAAITAPGVTTRGEVAEHALAFGLLAGLPVPIISGAFWFDGQTWHTSRGLMEIGHQNNFGMDDYGFGSAVRQPYRLGGLFTLHELAFPDAGRGGQAAQAWEDRIVQVLEVCPFPEQDRPEGDIRLGYAIPSSADRDQIVDQIDRATAAWWDQDPTERRLGDDTFVIGGRRLRPAAGDPGILTTVLGTAERWTVDALKQWTNDLVDVMTERWGEPEGMEVRHPSTGAVQRTPLTRIMRGTGLTSGPMWWVNGQAVLLLAGRTDPSYNGDPQAILVVCQTDTVYELLPGSTIWRTRLRARLISNVAAIAAAPEGSSVTTEGVTAGTPGDDLVAWDGPVLPGSDIVPLASRGVLRTWTHLWVWHFTHDQRALLTSHPIDGAPGEFAQQEALFAGLPEDLLSLVVDAEPGAPYPAVTRAGEPERAGLLGQARTLPDVEAVFFFDGHDWRAPAGMLRRARALSSNTGLAPRAALFPVTARVHDLYWALRQVEARGPSAMLDPVFASATFSRSVSEDEVDAAISSIGHPLTAALTGGLHQLLDVIVDGPGYRGVLDAVLSNVDPRSRRESALWLLGEGVDASTQLSFLTPISVLLANPTLDRGDAIILRRLLESGADPGVGLLGPGQVKHPLVQLFDLDIDEAELEPLLGLLLIALERAEAESEDDTEGVSVQFERAPLLPDGRSILEYASAGDFPHHRSRERMLEWVEYFREF